MTPTSRTRLAVVTTAAVAGIALAGCGVGGPANRVTIYQKNPGSNVAIQVSDGSINLRDVYIVPPASGTYQTGATAPLSLVAFNNTANPVTITGVSLVAPPTPQPGSTSGAVTGGVSFVAAGGSTAPSAGASAPIPRGTSSAGASGGSGTSASPSATAAASASGSAGASASASPSRSASASASATPSQGSGLSITIPAGGYLRLSPATGAYLALTNLSQDLPFGKAVGLTFTFSTGDSVTVQVSFGDPSAAPATTPTVFPVGG